MNTIMTLNDITFEIIRYNIKRLAAIPAQYHCFAPDFILQHDHSIQKRLCGRRTPRDVHIHRHNAIATAQDRVAVVIIATSVCTRSHRDYVARGRNRFVDISEKRSHLVTDGSGNNNTVRLAWTRTWNHTKLVPIISGRKRMHHLDSTTRQSKGDRPQRSTSHVSDNLINFQDDVLNCIRRCPRCTLAFGEKSIEVITWSREGKECIISTAQHANPKRPATEIHLACIR
eukprot:402279_1